MAYLDNSGDIIIDAILTRAGREKLAKGRSEFKITQFALSDDEIDYSLYNPLHPSGSAYYGAVIESMPLLEAVTDETQAMRSKLICLPRNAYRVPIVSVSNPSIVFTSAGQEQSITPSTKPFGNSTLGYTAILHDSQVADLLVEIPLPGIRSQVNTQGFNFISDSDASRNVVRKGFKFKLRAKQSPLEDLTTILSILGNETGGVVNISITVKKAVRPAAISDVISVSGL